MTTKEREFLEWLHKEIKRYSDKLNSNPEESYNHTDLTTWTTLMQCAHRFVAISLLFDGSENTEVENETGNADGQAESNEANHHKQECADANSEATHLAVSDGNEAQERPSEEIGRVKQTLG